MARPSTDRPPLSESSVRREQRRKRREAALALRDEMSPPAPAPDQFRVATWNVNGLRARSDAVVRFLGRTRPDVVCLQETKTSVVPSSILDALDDLGYALAHAGTGAYNGVAIASRLPIGQVLSSGDFGDGHLDREPRLVTCLVAAPRPVRIVSVYVPHGREVGHWHYDYKLDFLGALAERVKAWVDEGSLIVGGDFNVAPTDSDIFHPDAFVGLTHVTEPERTALATLLGAGLVDLDAVCWGAHERRFTWWRHGLNYSRNLGMRIDVLAADDRLARTLTTTWIDHLERQAERPSDHAALLAYLDLRPLDPELTA